jgi:hypothetical protein
LSKRCSIRENPPGSQNKTPFPRLAKAAAHERILKVRQRLLLPRALLVTMQAQLLAPFMAVDFCFSAFFE